MIQEQNILINRGSIEVLESEKVFLPSFNLKDEKLYITYLNLENKEVSLSFSDYNDTFFTEEDRASSVRRIYDLKELKSGNYLVKLDSGDRTFYYNFAVR